MEYVTALVIGLAGSLHCIGMCGPIVLALPQGEQSRLNFWIGRILYNLGRAVTYSVIGYICGHIGQTIFAGGYQQSLSIALGVLILLFVFLPSKYASYAIGARLHSIIMMVFKNLWARLMVRKSLSSLFVIGILNGFLPCGLVYIALAGAIATGNPIKGAVFMAVFGLGTMPVMLAMSLAGKLINVNFRKHLRRLIPVGGIILAVLFILRGMSLGIPYVSPKIETDAAGQTKVTCCHPAKDEIPGEGDGNTGAPTPIEDSARENPVTN